MHTAQLERTQANLQKEKETALTELRAMLNGRHAQELALLRSSQQQQLALVREQQAREQAAAALRCSRETGTLPAAGPGVRHRHHHVSASGRGAGALQGRLPGTAWMCGSAGVPRVGPRASRLPGPRCPLASAALAGSRQVWKGCCGRSPVRVLEVSASASGGTVSATDLDTRPQASHFAPSGATALPGDS